MLNVRISGIIVVTLVIYLADAKIFEKCELARELRDQFIPFHRIGTFVCIAERQSNLNTASVGEGLYYGMYQLSSEYWCDQNYAGKACSVQCSNLIDDDITDDLKCVQIIFDEHERLFNNGFNAWPSSKYCQSQGSSFVEECFIEDNQIIQPIKTVSRQEKISGNVGEGKVYERCELARELLNQHNVPLDQIATWVCIAKHESAYNTSAIGRLNWDGSEDHGLFQISDIYWCGESGKACGLQCSEVRDNNIADDVKCIKQIHAEHQRLSGDGFNAWAVYNPRCKGNSVQYAEGCFDSSENEIMQYKPVPGIQQPKKVYTQPTQQRKFYQKAAETGKVYERCELAQELRFKHKIPMEQVATWVCIAKHESSYNTSAIGRLNADGSEDHGLFQISDIYWCSPPGNGKGCGVTCSKFEDSDISDDVECMLKIHEEHTGLSGDGFNAWTVYRPHCKDRSTSYIEGCFNQNDVPPRPAITQPPFATKPLTTTEWVRTTETLTIPEWQKTIPEWQRTTPSKPLTTTTAKTTVRIIPTTPKIIPTTQRIISTTQKVISTTQKVISTTQRSIPTTTPAPTRTTTKFVFSTAPVTVKSTQKIITTTKPKATTASTTLKTTSKIITTTTPRTTQKAFAPATTTRKTIVTTTRSIPTTAVKPLFSSSTVKSTTTKSIAKSSTTVKPFNIFDSYFNSIPKGSNNVIKPIQKSIVYNAPLTTSKAPLTKSTKVYDQTKAKTVSIGKTTTGRTTWGNPYTKSAAINLAKTSVTTGKTTLNYNQAKTTTTKATQTPRTTQKIIKQSTVLQSTPKTQTLTKRTAATLKPFNLFAFYLNDYTSKAPINYRPVQFSDRSTVIIRKPDNFDKATTSTARASSTTVLKTNPSTTTSRRQEIKLDTQKSLTTSTTPKPSTTPKLSTTPKPSTTSTTPKPSTTSTTSTTTKPSTTTFTPKPSTTVRTLSIYNAFDDSGINSNRIGRVVKNITPHNFEYLLKLTTPRTAYNRS